MNLQLSPLFDEVVAEALADLAGLPADAAATALGDLAEPPADHHDAMRTNLRAQCEILAAGREAGW